MHYSSAKSAVNQSSASISPNAAFAPAGRFRRQLAAAFENSLIGMFFKRSLKSGSKLPHSKGFAAPKNAL
jgi:hypothetical protein